MDKRKKGKMALLCFYKEEIRISIKKAGSFFFNMEENKQRWLIYSC